MHSYAALLGHNPVLSIAELSAVLPDVQPDVQLAGDFNRRLLPPGPFLLFSTAHPIDQAFLNRLGGTILIARRITGDAVLTLDDLPAVLAAELSGVKGKAVFALRFVGVAPKHGHELLRRCKKGLRSRGVPSRYVGNERDPAKPIQLHDEGLLDPKRGAEVTIVQEKHQLWIGRTVAAQDVKAYTQRDIEKPVRDTTVGLLPPKLAQILLNFGEYLAHANEERGTRNKTFVVYDPFCGTGVIPLEALLRGNQVLASDVSTKAVNGTDKNMEWGRKTYKIAKKNVASVVWKQDATKPFALPKLIPDVIVTEGSLGPPFLKRPTVREIETCVRDAEDLAERFLRNCHACLPLVPIVLTLPVWYAQKRMIPLRKFSIVLDRCGYRSLLPPSSDGWLPDRLSLLYRRHDQFVGREIVLLQPKGKYMSQSQLPIMTSRFSI